jgi:hypothetical protein
MANSLGQDVLNYWDQVISGERSVGEDLAGAYRDMRQRGSVNYGKGYTEKRRQKLYAIYDNARLNQEKARRDAARFGEDAPDPEVLGDRFKETYERAEEMHRRALEEDRAARGAGMEGVKKSIKKYKKSKADAIRERIMKSASLMSAPLMKESSLVGSVGAGLIGAGLGTFAGKGLAKKVTSETAKRWLPLAGSALGTYGAVRTYKNYEALNEKKKRTRYDELAGQLKEGSTVATILGGTLGGVAGEVVGPDLIKNPKTRKMFPWILSGIGAAGAMALSRDKEKTASEGTTEDKIRQLIEHKKYMERGPFQLQEESTAAAGPGDEPPFHSSDVRPQQPEKA